MKKYLLSFLIIVSCNIAYSQGMSFSYLIPKSGYLSAPVSPFSIRGLGLGEDFGIETGASIYNVPGLAMEDLPFTYEKPLIGPQFALMIPVELFAKMTFKAMAIKLMVGGFIWWNINPRINEGNMDRAFREYEGWEVLNTNFDLKDKLGRGLMGGLEFEFFVSRKFSIVTAAQYLLGSAQAQLRGSYTGGDSSGLQTKEIDLKETAIQLSGIELSIGVILNH